MRASRGSKGVLGLLLGFFLMAGPAGAQAFSGSSTAFPILSVGLGPRAVGMGESFTAVADDLSAVHYNPAGLARIPQPELVLMHNSYLAGGFYDDLGGLYPFGKYGTGALTLNLLDYGSLQQRDSQGNIVGTFTPLDVDAAAAFGFNLGKDLSLGMGSQWIRQEIAGTSYMGLLWDFGLLTRLFPGFSAGVNLANLGVETGGYSFPAEIQAGTAYRILSGAGGRNSLLAAFGGVFSFQNAGRLNGGLEYGFEDRYFLRAGYSGDLGDEQLGWTKGLDFGAGARFGQVQLDYSFSFVGDLGDVQRFALSLFFDAPGKGPAPAARQAQGGLPPPLVFPGLPPSPAAPSTSVGTNHPILMKFDATTQDDLTAEQWFNLGEEKLKLGLQLEALDLYLKAVEKDPNFEKAWGRLGRLYFDKSLESYRKVLELEPGNERLKEWLEQFHP
jgi:tetratricopeptide (TPR) repeat protein